MEITIGNTTGGEWEENAQITAKELASGLVIKIEPVKIEVLNSTSEELDVDVEMSNGDEIEYRSYLNDAPYKRESDPEDYVRIRLNGELVFEDLGPEQVDSPSEEIIRVYKKFQE